MKQVLIIFVLPVCMVSTAVAYESPCLLGDHQQQSLILTEGPKALESESTNDCFKAIVRDEMQLLKDGESPIAGDREAAIEDLLQAASENQEFDKTQAE
jgi:hypothetical protein